MGITYSSHIYKPPHISDVNYLSQNISDIKPNNNRIYVRSLIANNVSNNKLHYVNSLIKNKPFDLIIMIIPYRKSLVEYKEFCSVLASMGVIVIVCKFVDETIYDSNQYINHDVVINILNDIINDAKQNLIIDNLINPSFNTITMLFHLTEGNSNNNFFKLVNIIKNSIIRFVFIDSINYTNTNSKYDNMQNDRVINLSTHEILKDVEKTVNGNINPNDVSMIFSRNITYDINRLATITSYIEIIAGRIINFITNK